MKIRRFLLQVLTISLTFFRCENTECPIGSRATIAANGHLASTSSIPISSAVLSNARAPSSSALN
jgi:hypothetical protein